MTPEAFVAARERLGWSRIDAAAALGVHPHILMDVEQGRGRVPRTAARRLAYEVALRHRDEAFASAGLDRCGELQAIVGEADGTTDPGTLKRLSARVVAHLAGCRACREREAYLDEHAPLPRPPTGSALMDAALALPDLLPRGLRPPAGDAGEGRRMGIFVAAFLTANAYAVVAGVALVDVVRHGPRAPSGADALLLCLLPAGYLLPFYLAGIAFDRTRRMRHRLAGYVLLGVLAAVAGYGSVSILVTAVDDSPMPIAAIPFALAFCGALGAIAGACLWVVHRLRGALPPPTSGAA